MKQPALLTAPRVSESAHRRRRFAAQFKLIHEIVEREGARAERQRAAERMMLR